MWSRLLHRSESALLLLVELVLESNSLCVWRAMSLCLWRFGVFGVSGSGLNPRNKDKILVICTQVKLFELSKPLHVSRKPASSLEPRAGKLTSFLFLIPNDKAVELGLAGSVRGVEWLLSFRHIIKLSKEMGMEKNTSITCRRERERKTEIDRHKCRRRQAEVFLNCQQTLSVPQSRGSHGFVWQWQMLAYTFN